MKNILFLFTIIPIMFSCKGQGKHSATSLADEAVQLADFDFKTKISTLLPENTKSKTYPGYYEVKHEVLQVDTIMSDGFDEAEKPLRVEYRKQNSSSRDVMAKFDDSEYSAINFLTTLDGNIMAINATIGNVDLAEGESFVKDLENKYGKTTKTKGEFAGKSFDIYTWKLKDRIISYNMVFNDDSNTLRIELDKDGKQVNKGQKSPHFEGYLFIVQKQYESQVFGQSIAGDFVYLN
ncbi:MAG: hypothetical protein ABIP95_12030 [Pelobium sp.]